MLMKLRDLLSTTEMWLLQHENVEVIQRIDETCSQSETLRFSYSAIADMLRVKETKLLLEVSDGSLSDKP